MGTQISVYQIYGFRLPDDSDWFELEERIGQCCNDGRAGTFQAGQYDNNMYFLATTWRELDPGEYSHFGTLVGGFDETRYSKELDWNTELRFTAARFGLTIIDGPGWFVIVSED